MKARRFCLKCSLRTTTGLPLALRVLLSCLFLAQCSFRHLQCAARAAHGQQLTRRRLQQADGRRAENQQHALLRQLRLDQYTLLFSCLLSFVCCPGFVLAPLLRPISCDLVCGHVTVFSIRVRRGDGQVPAGPGDALPECTRAGHNVRRKLHAWSVCVHCVVCSCCCVQSLFVRFAATYEALKKALKVCRASGFVLIVHRSFPLCRRSTATMPKPSQRRPRKERKANRKRLRRKRCSAALCSFALGWSLWFLAQEGKPKKRKAAKKSSEGTLYRCLLPLNTLLVHAEESTAAAGEHKHSALLAELTQVNVAMVGQGGEHKTIGCIVLRPVDGAINRMLTGSLVLVFCCSVHESVCSTCSRSSAGRIDTERGRRVGVRFGRCSIDAGARERDTSATRHGTKRRRRAHIARARVVTS